MRHNITKHGNTITIHGDGTITFLSGANIDTDGVGQSHGDKTHQGETSLRYRGRPLDADEENYIVVPRWVACATRPAVLGCQCYVRIDGMKEPIAAVVGDIGPEDKLGEVSYALAGRLGIPQDPNMGGLDVREVIYQIIPGQPAAANGRVYSLQPLVG